MKKTNLQAGRHSLRRILIAAALIASAGIAHAQEKLTFPSADFADKYKMSHAKGTPTQVFGYLTMPSIPVTGKIPVIVIAHGSGGVEPKDRDFWAPYFNKLGFAAFIVDSFTPRGVSRTVDDQTLVSRAANTVDALYALKFLAADPRFDAGRIGIIGFSRGGDAATEAATRSFKNNVLPENTDLQFAFHIPMYLGCQDGRYRKNDSFDKTGAPMLFLLGSKDNYTPAAQCTDLIKDLQTEYPSAIDYRIYDGANHSFDENYGVKYDGNGVTSRDCAVLEIDIKTWAKRVVATNEVLTPAREKEFYKSCVTRGVTWGSQNTKYRDMAAVDIEAFLKRIKIIEQ
ncbi:MAG: dienelactone hydrolase [Herbaspirillum sp.]|jgi:dienelactone hydrolase|nr:dienelactone hydrolase [Herbaspirillum sp.]